MVNHVSTTADESHGMAAKACLTEGGLKQKTIKTLSFFGEQLNFSTQNAHYTAHIRKRYPHPSPNKKGRLRTGMTVTLMLGMLP